MTHPTVETAIIHEFAQQAAAAPDGADVRGRIRAQTVDAPLPRRARLPWLVPALASATVAAIAVTLAVLTSHTDGTPTHRTDSPPAASSAAKCTAQQLSISIVGGPAYLASSALARFTNTTPTACTLSGYPTVLAKTANNPQTIAKQTLAGPLGGLQDRSTPPQITLNHGDTATSMTESNDGDGVATDCKTFDHLAVSFNPNAPATVLAISMALCNLEVHPYIAGLTGTSQPSAVLGQPYSAKLLVHCGVTYATFAGRTWKITAPVPAWRRVSVNGITTDNGHIQGTMTLTDPTTLTFTIQDPGVSPNGAQFTFHPTQEHPPLCV